MPKIVDKQAKKAQILHAAIAMFAEKGVANTKIADIAKAAGIGKGTVYEYYAGKEEIFQDAMDQFFHNMEASILSSMQDFSDPREKLKNVVYKSVEGFQSHFEYLQITLDFWAIGLRSDQVWRWKKAYKFYIEMISAIIDEGIKKKIFRPLNSRALASAMIGMIDGLMFQLVLFKEAYPIQETVDTILENFIKGLEAGSS